MKIQEGDVLICQCEDCDIELTVTKSCSKGECGTGSEVDLKCCEVDMAVKPR